MPNGLGAVDATLTRRIRVLDTYTFLCGPRVECQDHLLHILCFRIVRHYARLIVVKGFTDVGHSRSNLDRSQLESHVDLLTDSERKGDCYGYGGTEGISILFEVQYLFRPEKKDSAISIVRRLIRAKFLREHKVTLRHRRMLLRWSKSVSSSFQYA
ncbi:hypothetical protein Scep_016345 [Stephania cephalantha]|uniref:Uncharacterized protein n=1 Tax=Stephania cephalantha TaxID=152367 RepID=A0AAP0NSI6_9MAGN